MHSTKKSISKKAIYDKKHGFGKEGDYEAKQLAKVSSGSATYMKGQPHMYGAPKMQGQPHMESNKQQKSNLMNDNPVAKHASNSWLSKHMK